MMRKYRWSVTGIIAWIWFLALIAGAMVLAHFGPVTVWHPIVTHIVKCREMGC